MVVDKKVLGKLRSAFDLNLYEVKIWTALLSRGISTAGELSDITDVPRSRAYDVLESLERKGFVVMKLGKPIRYIAIQPQEIIERMKKKAEMDATDKISRLEKLKDTEMLGELKKLYEQGVEMIEPSELSGALKGRHNIHDHLDLMVRDAEETIDILTTGSEFKRLVEYHLPSLKAATEKGVKVRIAAPIDAQNAEAAKAASEFAQIRHIDHIDARFYVIDSDEVLFMIMPESEVHPTYDTGIWVHSPFFASALSSLFEHAWEHLDKIEAKIKSISAKS